MKLIVSVLLLAGCSVDGQDAAKVAREEQAPLADGNQSRAAIPGQLEAVDSKTQTAAAQIMAGGFRPDGSFVHGDHIHKAGQEKCPSNISGGPVQ